jgi:hypothetical protein
MSEKNMERMVKEFLEEVKKKLPDWLTDKKSDLRDVLEELEDHIWNKAEELSDTGNPTEDSVRLAIAHMGTPESIAKEYKRRGTPKVYITEEMWPLYKKVLITVILIIVALNVIGGVFNLITGDLWGAAESFSSFYGIFLAATIITIIFVALSMQGYLPEDFKSKSELRREQRELEIAREKGFPTSPKTGKPLKPFIKPAGEIVGGILGIGFGFFLLIIPIPALVELLNPEFILLLRIIGLISIIEGSFNLTRGLIGNEQPQTHQKILVMTLMLKFASLAVVVIMWNRPDIFPIFNWNNETSTFINIGIATQFYDVYKIVFTVIILFTVVGIIEDLYNIIKLENYKVKY